MICVEPATRESFEEVHPLLQQIGADGAAVSTEQWRWLFDYPWQSDENRRGFVLRDGKRVVGFIGALFFERQIDGRTEKFQNPTSWITLPGYRNQSLLLFEKMQEDASRTIVGVSPHKKTYPLFIRCGFQDLETSRKMLWPWPSLRNARQWFSGTVTTNPGRIAEKLDPALLPLLEHHRKLRCGHLLACTPRGSCYVVFTKLRGRRANFAHVQFISDKKVFAENLDRIKLRLCLAIGTPFVMIDSRLVAGLALPHSRDVALATPHVFRSATLRADQIDNLYTERMVLNL